MERIIKDKKLRVNNTSGFCGVTRQNGKWRAFLVYDGKFYSLGTYDDIEEAVRARLEAEARIVKPLSGRQQTKRRGRPKTHRDHGKSIIEVYEAFHPRA